MAYWVSNVVWGGTIGYPSNRLASCFYFFAVFDVLLFSDVKSSRPKWPLWAKILASASASSSKFWPQPWPRPQTFGLGLASISLSYYIIGHFSGKNLVKFGKFVILNHMLLITIWYFFIIIFGLGLGLNLQKFASASASASRFWPRLTSLPLCR